MTLNEINQLAAPLAHQAFMQCCTSQLWVEKMVAGRPYRDQAALFAQASNSWQQLNEADYLAAFDGHPKIGDVSSLREKYRSTEQLAAGEQSGVNSAQMETLAQLKQQNGLYHEKYGFIFIVCATGKSAEQMLSLLQQRLVNDRAQEVVNAAAEQGKIFILRLQKMLQETRNEIR
jgi:2-oxo-4-hydroxy-4-carboxy-5-ureidoimidazoline decarboxylase